jgi:hypothetical protein
MMVFILSNFLAVLALIVIATIVMLQGNISLAMNLLAISQFTAIFAVVIGTLLEDV